MFCYGQVRLETSQVSLSWGLNAMLLLKIWALEIRLKSVKFCQEVAEQQYPKRLNGRTKILYSAKTSSTPIGAEVNT